MWAPGWVTPGPAPRMALRPRLPEIRTSGDKPHGAGWSRQLLGGDGTAHLGRSRTEQGRQLRAHAGAWGDGLAAVLGGPSTTCSWWPRLRAARPSQGCLPYRPPQKAGRGGPGPPSSQGTGHSQEQAAVWGLNC